MLSKLSPPMQPPLVTELVRYVYSVVPPGTYMAKPHLHHYHQLDVYLAGAAVARIENARPVRVGAGYAYFIPPLLRHDIRSPRGCRTASFKFHLAPRHWPAFGTRARAVRLSKGLLACIEHWSRAYQAGGTLLPERARAVLTLCLVEAFEMAGPRAARADGDDELDAFRQRLWPVLERIANQPHHEWSVSQMAADCHLSTDHFSRCFQRVVTQTPKRFLLGARLRAAATELTADPRQPIKTVSERASYTTVHAFTRAFTEFFGVSPGAYRDQAERH